MAFVRLVELGARSVVVLARSVAVSCRSVVCGGRVWSSSFPFFGKLGGFCKA